MEIKEAYVSYDVAKLLYEKGFDEPCDMYYKKSEEADEPQELTWDELNYNRESFMKAPTHQMVNAWLRQKYNLFIYLIYEPEYGFCFKWFVKVYKDGIILQDGDSYRDSDYDSLMDHAIEYTVRTHIAATI